MSGSSSPTVMFLSAAGAMMLFRFVVAYERPPEGPGEAPTASLSPSNLARKANQDNKSSIRRSDSEFSMCSDYSLGMSRSESLADIVKLSRGMESLGEFCSGGKVAVEVLKFLGSGVVVCGVIWKLLDLTAPQAAKRITE
mmetsp:Transcript_17223/g.28824  ORF Transcript_17223/g.28824 Transcript_17223/m.28824 type:complete len:140 (-) Transcript_17223:167-586(-)|eukprot:CAMPEP_0114430316 /NCGR_PEP_ID=MMETSP0103-20121206/9976_1 /TAXON_ID=37642 ORGANISM="Paraphysomonas imperforata, Strain PA2" /NCGR_SAMPLE_ID=MMETSP0103 /ASSEMBLY_ACC=CAM_ASM_000201 /LENGTH=139 /DNA_ID=CAMNT_0001599755 /DNA_START=284 /DNA_END=706 /DNA_ORIENTATION=-